MVRIGDAIQEIVKQNLLYSMLLNTGLVNYASLARKIQKQVESITGNEVKINTIVKVLSGLKSEEGDSSVLEILRRSSLTAEYRYTEEYRDDIEGLGDRLMLAIKDGDGYRCILKSAESTDLALIRILLPEESSGEPGITLLVVQYLNVFGLDIRNIYRLDKEIWLTVKIAEAGAVLDKLGKFLYNSQT